MAKSADDEKNVDNSENLFEMRTMEVKIAESALVKPDGKIDDGAVCAAQVNCKNVGSCCNTFAKTSGGAAVSTKLVCFPADNAITKSFAIPVVTGITAANLDAGKGFPTVACPKATIVAKNLSKSLEQNLKLKKLLLSEAT